MLTPENVRGHKIIKGLSYDEVSILLEHINKKELNPLDVLFDEGDASEETMYFIIQGSIDVLRKGRSDYVKFASLNEGELVGEFAFFNDAPRSAKCMAAVPSVLGEFKKSDYTQLLEKNPTVAAKFLENIILILIDKFNVLTSKAERATFWL